MQSPHLSGQARTVFWRSLSAPLPSLESEPDDSPRPIHVAYAAIAVAIGYYIGAILGVALTPTQHAVSTLWPPNAILLGALLLAPESAWPMLIAATFPAHVLVEVQAGVPLAMVLSWFLSNSLEALLGAWLIRRFADDTARLDTYRRVGVFLVFGTFFAPFATSFIDAAFVKLNAFDSAGYWQIWRARFFSDVLAILTLVPPIVAWGAFGRAPFRFVGARRILEAVALAGGLLAVCTVVLTRPSPTFAHAGTAMLYAPLPFLLWAAVRFGPAGASTSLLVFSVLSVWGEIHHQGPFVTNSHGDEVLALQIFLIVTYVPLLVLAAVLRERAHAEIDARSSRDQLSLAMDAAHATAWDWVVARDSLECDEFFGAIHHDDRSLVREAMWNALKTRAGYEAEYRIVRPHQGVRWVLSKGRVLCDGSGRAERMVGVTADVTERKRAEEAIRIESTLRESAAQLREMADAMPQVVFTATPDGRVDFFNARWWELTGKKPEEITEDTWFLALHEDDRAGCRETMRANLLAGRPHEHEGRFWSAAAKAYRWHLVRAFPVRDRSNAIRRWYGTATDIDDQKRVEQAVRVSESRFRALGEELETRVAERTTELSQANLTLRAEIDSRVRTEQALRESEERFAKAFRTSPDAISIARHAENRIIEVNERWQNLFGYSREDAIGRSFEELGICKHDAMEKIAVAMDANGCVRELDVEVHNRAGETLSIVLACDTVDVGGDACLITMIRDITERRRAEQLIAEQRRQLAHLGRVAVLGELSGALAHELNQPLTAILANARAAQRLMTREKYDAGEIRSILDDIATDDLRAGAVIRRLRALIRNGETVPQQVAPNDVVRDVLELAHNDLILREVTVTTQLEASLPNIPADRVQLQQVVLNLVVNACDAMTDKPRADRHLVVRTVRDDGSVELSFSDRGTGIVSGAVDSVFEPFMTTKEHGLGLGLAICRSIVSAHGGKMWAVNNVDVGATFYLRLPIEYAGHPAPDETVRRPSGVQAHGSPLARDQQSVAR